jgi:hypothetical protein
MSSNKSNYKPKTQKRQYKSNNYTRKNNKKFNNIIDIPVITTEKELFEFFDNIPPDISFNKTVQTHELQTPKELSYSIYQNLNRESIINTFMYMFFHIRLGIFIQIKDNKLVHFLPFQNQKYTNNWSDDLIPFKNNQSTESYYTKKKNKYPNNMDSDINNIQSNKKKWSANNCLIGNWNKEQIGTGAWKELKEMIELTCNNHTVNDCIFFINRRDHPVITGNGKEESYRKEPYFHIFNNMTTPLSRHSYKNYIPILGFSKNDNFADLLIPNYEDWNYIKSVEDKAFDTFKLFNANSGNEILQNIKNNKTKTSKKMEKQIIDEHFQKLWKDELNKCDSDKWVRGLYTGPVSWKHKFNKAIFRGSPSGCGTNPQNNQRIRLGRIAQIEGMDSLMDVGILGTNIRDKKYIDKQVDFYDSDLYKFPEKDKLTFEQQTAYKYIIHIDGHVSAYRLGRELSSNSTILKVDSLFDYKLWFSDHLIPNYHYLPIKKDLSNIKSAILACQTNDKTCEKISENAKKLFLSIFNRHYITAFWANLINSVSNKYII